MWERKQEAERRREEKERTKEQAIELTQAAQAQLQKIAGILRSALAEDSTIDWENLKDFSPFPKPQPHKPQVPEMLPEPKAEDNRYQPQFGLLDKLLQGRARAKLASAEAMFHLDHKRWKDHRQELAQEHRKSILRFKEEAHRWAAEKKEFLTRQKRRNAAVDRAKQAYLSRSPDTITRYCKKVLTTSRYPDAFPQTFRLDYTPDTKIVLVDYSLPRIDDLPTLNEVKYIQTRDELKEVHLPEAARNKAYDDLLYQIALRSVHELYQADVADAIDSVVFNGWVRSLDAGTGHEVDACILSVQASKEEFLAIDLAQVDPKQCFKTLKGVGSSKLHGLAAVQPIMRMDRRDDRFAESYGVAEGLDDSVNLAVMDWEDFEHLIREVFEAEFSGVGGEVRITRASRDRGVDAIAFDPDPIRGGKIVIQAKRYTNVVEVSAVRDLFGTVVNEGATKGILVTTSNYGPDAYAFAKGKPLTLLDGSNLLHLLGKHGHRAKIDLKEAKRLLAQQED